MNKTLLVVLIALGASPLIGTEPCKITSGDKQIKLNTAQCYAHQLAKLTAGYLDALEAQVSAQEGAYDRLAGLYSSAERINVDLAMGDDRDNAVQVWIRHLTGGSMNVSSVLEDVARIAKNEFQTTRAQHEQDLDGKAAYLQTLNHLEVDTKKVASLSDLFVDLTHPPDLKSWVSDLGAYGQGVQTQMKQAGCALAKSRLQFFTSESARLAGMLAKSGLSQDQKSLYTDQKKADDDQLKAMQDETGKCPAPLQP